MKVSGMWVQQADDFENYQFEHCQWQCECGREYQLNGYVAHFIIAKQLLHKENPATGEKTDLHIWNTQMKKKTQMSTWKRRCDCLEYVRWIVDTTPCDCNRPYLWHKNNNRILKEPHSRNGHRQRAFKILCVNAHAIDCRMLLRWPGQYKRAAIFGVDFETPQEQDILTRTLQHAAIMCPDYAGNKRKYAQHNAKYGVARCVCANVCGYLFLTGRGCAERWSYFQCFVYGEYLIACGIFDKSN